MLSVRHLVKRLPSGRELLRGVEFDVRRGEFVGVLGPSGAGKSLTLRCITGLTRPDEGSVRFAPSSEELFEVTAMRGRALRRVRRQMGVVFQNFNLVERLSVLENVLIGRLGWISPIRSWIYGFTDGEAAEALQALGQVEMGSFADRRTGTLSRGEMQRVAIARAIFQKPAIFLADEPISSLDPRNARAIMEILARIARITPVLGTFHQPEMVARYCTRVVAIKDGAVVYEGDPQIDSRTLAGIYGEHELEQMAAAPPLVKIQTNGDLSLEERLIER